MSLKAIPGYEGFYAAGIDGTIYRTERYGRKIQKPIALRVKKGGYLVAHLCKDAVRRDLTAHRAVWTAFNGPVPVGLEINHKNGVKSDNRLVNLEVCTKSENIRHRFRVLHHPAPNFPSPGVLNGSAKLTEDDIRAIRKLGAEGVFQKEIGLRFGISQVMSGKIVRRDNWSHVQD